MWYNPIMIWLLRSPFHKMLSGSIVLLTLTGRKSGRTIEVPVNYIRDGKTLWVAQRPKAGLVAQLDRRRPTFGHAGAQDQKSSRRGHPARQRGRACLDRVFQARPHMAKYFKVKIDREGNPDLTDLGAAARGRVVVKITLT